MIADAKREPTGAARLAIDIGPLLVFFLVNFLAPVPGALKIFVATGAFMAAMVAAYIGAAYWFTASTSFANPAAVFGRLFSDSFAGIAPGSAPGFVFAELIGAAAAVGVHRLLSARPAAAATTTSTETRHV